MRPEVALEAFHKRLPQGIIGPTDTMYLHSSWQMASGAGTTGVGRAAREVVGGGGGE